VGFDVVADRDERADLLARHEATHPHLLASRFGFRSASQTGRWPPTSVRRTVESAEAEARKRTEEEAAWGARSGQIEQTPDEQREARKAERKKAATASVKARAFNGELGRNLVKRRGKGTRREHSLAGAKAVAAVLLADNQNLPARGLRLVLPQLQDVEVKELKSGEERQRIDYSGIPECLTYIENRVAEANSADEVALGSLGRAGVARPSARVGPAARDEASMPGEQGLWGDEEGRPTPPGQKPSGRRQGDAIRRPQIRPMDLTAQDGERVPEDDDL
jgi:hypothetical protein